MGVNPAIPPTKQITNPHQLNDIGFRVILIPFCGIAIPLISRLIPHQQLSLLEVKMSYLYTIGIAFIVWQGNRYLLFTLRSYFNWFNHPMRKIGALLLVIPFYTVPISVLLLIGWYHIFLDGNINWSTVMETTLIILLAVVFIVHVYETVFLVKESESEMLLNAQLQRARAEAELEALRNQIDPHFVFNSLNTLSHLIDSSPKKARLFNDNLAEVYRYILQNKNSDLVLLREEFNFLRNYFSLLEIRFGNALQLETSIDDSALDSFLLPPISLQLLMENAIKHNEFSRQHPLLVRIERSGDAIIFSNDTTKLRMDRTSNGIGLKNLSERYRIITAKNIEIKDAAGYFTVKLPLLLMH